VLFELGNACDLAEKLEYVYRQPESVAATVVRGQRVYRDHCWSRERQRLLELVRVTLGVNGHEEVGHRDSIKCDNQDAT